MKHYPRLVPRAYKGSYGTVSGGCFWSLVLEGGPGWAGVFLSRVYRGAFTIRLTRGVTIGYAGRLDSNECSGRQRTCGPWSVLRRGIEGIHSSLDGVHDASDYISCVVRDVDSTRLDGFSNVLTCILCVLYPNVRTCMSLAKLVA